MRAVNDRLAAALDLARGLVGSALPAQLAVIRTVEVSWAAWTSRCAKSTDRSRCEKLPRESARLSTSVRPDSLEVLFGLTISPWLQFRHSDTNPALSEE